MNWASITLLVLIVTSLLIQFRLALDTQDYRQFNIELVSMTLLSALIYFSGGFQ